MSATPAAMTSQRLLALLSLLQSHRDWPAPTLAARLNISERTIRRDVDRLRELGYTIDTTRGPDGGYRLGAGDQLPPLLFDDEQALALAIALRTARASGAGIQDAADRALQTVIRMMPDRLAQLIARLDVDAVETGTLAIAADPEVLLRIGDAIHRHEELRFDYNSPGRGGDDAARPPRRVQPHHVLLHDQRWYLIGWSAEAEDWRVYRVDRIDLRMHNGARFTPRTVPGGDAAEFLAARFKGSNSTNEWPCIGEVIVSLPAVSLVPFVGDGAVESLGPDRCRYRSGAWSWIALAAQLGRLDAEIEVVGPPELKAAFGELARRFVRAAG